MVLVVIEGLRGSPCPRVRVDVLDHGRGVVNDCGFALGRFGTTGDLAGQGHVVHVAEESSIAALVLTTEALVLEQPEEAPAMSGGHDQGGGMDL